MLSFAKKQAILKNKGISYKGYNMNSIQLYRLACLEKTRDICIGNDFLRTIAKIDIPMQVRLFDGYDIVFNNVSYYVTRSAKQIDRKVSLMFVTNFAVFWGLDFSDVFFIGEQTRRGYIKEEDIPEAWRLPYQ